MDHWSWPSYAKKTLNDGKFTDIDNLEGYCFPGYIGEQNFPLIPLNVLTHRFSGTLEADTRWCAGDDPSLFKKNKEKLGDAWHYSTKQIEYKVNANGYRAPEWNDIDWKEAVVILGCSMTFGVGVAEDETISYLLQERLGRPVINIGYPAGSNEAIFNNSVSIFENFGCPAAVVTAWSTLDRFLFFSSYMHDIGLWTKDSAMVDGVELQKLYDFINLNQINVQVKGYYLEKASRSFWKDRTHYYSMSFFPSTAHYMRVDKYFTFTNTARDLIHPGVESNREVAEHLFEVLKERGL